jgi:hypothetical protein
MSKVLNDKTTADIARDAIPGYRQAAAALAAVQSRRPAHLPGDGSGALVAEVVRAATAGEPVPDDIGRRAFEQTNAAQYAEAERSILARATEQLRQRLVDAHRAGADAGIRALQPHLADLLEKVRAGAADLGSIRDDESAVAAGPAGFTAWHDLGPLADRYLALRGTWGELLRIQWSENVEFSQDERITMGTSMSGVQPGEILSVAGEFSNLGEVWPGWMDHRQGLHADPHPWPGEVRAGHAITYPRDRAYLVWLATDPTVKPWLPTSTEARTAYVAQRATAADRKLAADEVAQYGRARTQEERMKTAAASAAQQIRRVNNAAASAASAL